MNREEFKTARAAYACLTISQLIELLGSAELQVRFLAEMALRDATSTWLHFQPAAQQEEREKAIAEWREWWREHQFTQKKRWQKT